MVNLKSTRRKQTTYSRSELDSEIWPKIHDEFDFVKF